MSALKQREKEEIVNTSLKSCIYTLKQHRKAFLVRGTGFGKTWIGSELARTTEVIGKHWDKVIYIVPLLSIQEGITTKYEDKLKCVEHYFLTYQQLGILWSDLERNPSLSVEDACSYLKGMNNGLFIFEEAHRFGFYGDSQEGVNKSSRFIKRIKERFPNAYYFGSTATPYRTDRADTGYTFFEGNLIFPYTLKDGIRDGFYRKPIYAEGVYDIESLTSEIAKNIQNSKSTSADKKRILTAEMMRWANFYNIPDIIKGALDETDCSKDYMRFLVYFSNHQTLHARYREVITWFEEAYPNMVVRPTIVTSDSSADIDEECGNLVYKLDKKVGTIDLVFSINKLVMGYHDSLVTGVMLMRLTASNIMYQQIVGRCFDMEMQHQTVILDIVGNIDVETGKLMRLSSITNSKGKKDKERYPIGFDKDCVEFSSRSVNVNEVERMFDEDRLQWERELVWNFKNGRLDAEFCALELNIDIEAWNNVLKYHDSISGNERHEDV